MKKLLSMLFVAMAMLTFGFAQTPTVETGTNVKGILVLNPNTSSKVFRNLTGVSYMNGLNATKVTAPVDATSAILTITLDKVGTTKLNFKKNTYTITVGYVSCQVKDYVNWTELPKVVTVDLTKVECTNGKVKNFLPALLTNKQRIAVFFAKINGSTHDGEIVFK